MVQVQVKQGTLQGIQSTSVLNGQIYYSFLGIPFAKPPIGELRFRAPQPPENWTGVRQADKEGPGCAQYNAGVNQTIGDEDCLYLNVFTPENLSQIKTPKAVMVYIYGGGFYEGSASLDDLSPDFLIIQDVIIVTIQYRLHVLGFLNIDSPHADFNCGLKDQNMALKWIKENIEAFGGDNNNITIFGNSCGATSVYMHMVSPASEGLFHKAIIQSGTFIRPRAINEQPWETALELGRKLGYAGNDLSQLVAYFRKISPNDLSKAVYEMQQSARGSHILMADRLFMPSIEAKNDNNTFLPDYPYNLSKKAKPVPAIAGINNKEGRLLYAIWSHGTTEIFRDKLSDFIADNLPQCSASKILEITPKVRQFYFGNEEITEKQKESMIDLFTDLVFFLNFYESLDYIVSSDSPLYVYDFKFYGRLNKVSQQAIRDGETMTDGACHADEVSYIFYIKKFMANNNITLQEPEITTVKNMTKLWTNFAKTKNPTDGMANVTWKPNKRN